MNDALEFEVVVSALGFMGDAPADLSRSLQAAASIKTEADKYGQENLLARLIRPDPNDIVRIVVHRKLLEWDHSANADWCAGTPPNSPERRAAIYDALRADASLRLLCDAHFPVAIRDEPLLIIARDHEHWYTPEIRRVRNFYWSAYEQYLRVHNGWTEDDLADLGESSAEVVARLSDPSRRELYQAKGLVVGYVQSGKTANFTGVIARAADAGYRLVILLSGTMNILRKQTQRRIDKELIGKDLIRQQSVVGDNGDAETDYLDDDEWDEFISHGGRPSEHGAFDWQRLTGPEYEYHSLKRGIDALEFDGERLDKTKPFFDPVNLHGSKARLMVIKKNGAVLRRVAKDLARIRARLADIPTLVIDDESDQASLNTKQSKADRQSRSTINRAIVELLHQLPRAQYVGYTATPFANVFVDPDDQADLFPKDFIISLPRPSAYMGVREFHDLVGNPGGYDSNERAYVRDVRGDDVGALNLPKAIDSYVLTGALKSYRHDHGIDLSIKHHTMLVHTSHLQVDHQEMAERIRHLLKGASYNAGAGLGRLKELYETDFVPVTEHRTSEYGRPPSFEELKPHIGSCWGRLNQGEPVLIVNGLNEKDSPDFDRTSVWKIIVGGAKLSRGYTVEGLTVSYYRRTAGAADTLMQMGRWFGFRRGYSDLVRLFIGREEEFGAHPIDLYSAFLSICRDEIEFRSDLRRYAMPGDGSRPITPMQVPPLVPQHLTLLRPTASNKMFNAEVKSQNFGGESKTSTLAPTVREDKIENERSARHLLRQLKLDAKHLELTSDGVALARVRALVGTTSHASVVEFLRTYRWSRLGPFRRELEYLETPGNGIADWLILAPQLASAEAGVWKAGDDDFTVVRRAREANGRYNVYTEPHHVVVAEWIVGIGAEGDGNADLRGLRGRGRAVMLLYAVRDAPQEALPPNIGFSISLPRNQLPTRIVWGVRDPDQPDAVVVVAPLGN